MAKAAVQPLEEEADPIDYVRTVPTANAIQRASGMAVKQPIFQLESYR